MAYNCNLDNIVKVSQIEKYARPPELRELNKPEDLFACIAYSMKHEESAELIMNEQVEEWLRNSIAPYKQRMGGQIGIMANQLSSFGMKPVVYTPLLYKEICKMFAKNILLVDGSLKKPGEIKRNDRRKINWIFEFDKGQKFGKVTAKSVNRFIAASRPDEFRIAPFGLDFDFSCSILSGFHAFKEKYSDGTTYKDQFRLANELVDRVNERRKPVHIEVAYTSSRKIMKEIVRLASKADSIGLDESELMLILGVLGHHKLENKIHKEHDVRDVLAGLEKMQKKMKTGKIHLHGFGYYMALSSKDYHASADVLRRSMQFASVVASSVASGSSLVEGLKNQSSLAGRKKEALISGKLESREDVVFMPASLVKKVRNVVGLGDIISASIFVAEVAHHD
jgi:ADP-dependent phosphofructokinase/glucokinase